MVETLKVLGQVAPSATTLTVAYTVPAATSTVVSSIIICNSNNTNQTFRISIAPAGAADNIKQYMYYDLPILANDTFIATVGISLATTDVVRCYASATNMAFQLSGVEVT